MRHALGHVTRDTGSPQRSDDWTDTPAGARDWKKVVLIAGLGILSWVATYVGMLKLIEANMGELPLVHKAIVGFSVAMLMIMIVWLLDQLFAPLPFLTKLLYALGYVFLTIISVGFGFGFYWKVLESRSEASRAAEGAVGQVQSALLAASTRLDQLQSTLDSLTGISRSKAENERNTGTSCPASRAGDGPRRKMREDDAARFSFASDLVKGRATQVKTEIAALEADLLKIARNDRSILDAQGTRNEFMRSLGRKLDGTVTGFNAFRTDPQLRQIRTDLAERADRTTFPDSRGGTYSCPDPQLSAALKGVVRAIDGLPELEKPRIATVEGSEATIEAFRRLTATFHGLLTFRMPPSADEQRDLQRRAVQSVESPQAAARIAAAATSDQQSGLSRRDYVPLAVALFVDLCLLLVSMGRPINRLGGLLPKMREAERGPVIQILSRFSEIHRDENMRESFEVLRHVVFDYAGAYYVAVPLDAPYVETRREQVVDPATRKARLVTRQIAIPPPQRERLRVEAHLIANLFASFEKDNVFKRVMWLNVDSARRRLARQGSKFANAEAFRIYRFTDGAWSEIILGAVMGAARRVEAARAAGKVDAFGRREPSFDELADRLRQAEEETEAERLVPSPKPTFERSWAAHPAHRAAAQPRSHAVDPEMTARFGPYAGSAQEEHTAPAASSTVFPAARELQETVPQPLAPDGGNVLPFPSPPAPRAAFDELPEDPGDLRMPGFMSRAQAAGAARPADPPAAQVADVETAGVTVTATERSYSFVLPLGNGDARRGVYGIAGILRRDAQAETSPLAETQLAPLGALPSTGEPASRERGTIVPYAGSAADRSNSLSLPAPIREHEHRG
jgi:hypothetical protein